MLEFTAGTDRVFRVECKAVVEASDISILAIVALYEPNSISGEFPDNLFSVLVQFCTPGYYVSVRPSLDDKGWTRVDNEHMAETWAAVEPMLEAVVNDEDVKPLVERVVKDYLAL